MQFEDCGCGCKGEKKRMMMLAGYDVKDEDLDKGCGCDKCKKAKRSSEMIDEHRLKLEQDRQQRPMRYERDLSRRPSLHRVHMSQGSRDYNLGPSHRSSLHRVQRAESPSRYERGPSHRPSL